MTSKTQKRHCLRRSTSRRIRIIIYSLVELSFPLVCKDGMQPSSMPKWYFLPVHSYADAHPALHKGPRHRTVAHCLHRKSLAHVGDGERDKGYTACDIAFERFHSSHVTFLIKVCMFVLGFLILLRSLRPSSCLCRESPSMGSHAWTTLLLLSATTQFVMWSRCVYDALLRVE